MYTLTTYTTQPNGNKLTETTTNSNLTELQAIVKEQLAVLIAALDWGVANVAFNIHDANGNLLLETSFYNGPVL